MYIRLLTHPEDSSSGGHTLGTKDDVHDEAEKPSATPTTEDTEEPNGQQPKPLSLKCDEYVYIIVV